MSTTHKKHVVRKTFRNNTTYTNDLHVAQLSNDYHSTRASDLESQVPQSTFDPLSLFPINSCEPSLLPDPVSTQECNTVINSLKISKSDIDTLPIKILKTDVDVSSRVITDLANKFFTDGCFPTCLELGAISLILREETT